MVLEFQITSLNALNVNPTYQKLLRVYADDNKITSLLELEASKFIESFDTFFLRRNMLKTIPMYILSNTLDKIPDGRLLYLEGNRLHCDCNSAKSLKVSYSSPIATNLRVKLNLFSPLLSAMVDCATQSHS